MKVLWLHYILYNYNKDGATIKYTDNMTDWLCSATTVLCILNTTVYSLKWLDRARIVTTPTGAEIHSWLGVENFGVNMRLFR